jgi:tetratricopeptide (TPR) repeat protein
MSPEQALGDVERVDQRSDVFGLGAILCEILTGAPPYREADGDLVRQASTGALEGAFERLQNCGADDSLIALCTECLARARRARPESAAEVAARVGAYLTSVEERARRAELSAAEARYKHRTTLLSSAAALIVVLLLAGVWIWNEDQAQTRRAEAMQRVASAMSSASGARGQAQAAGLDAALWSAAVSSAEQAVSFARSDAIDPAARAAAETLLTEVGQERDAAASMAATRMRDATMLARLEGLRLPVEDDLMTHGWKLRESRRLDVEYENAFTEYLGGDSPLDGSLPEVLAGIRAGEIDLILALALDHWSLVLDRARAVAQSPVVERTARLRELAAELDPDDVQRSELRALLPGAGDAGAELHEFVDRADLAVLTADGCRVLAEALCHAGQKQSVVEVLQRGLELDPDDFGLCIELALHLEMLPDPPWNDVLAVYRIAHALNPGHVGVLHRLGVALERIERAADAERVFRRVVALDPSSAHALCHLGWVLSTQGKRQDAVQAFERALEVDPQWSDAQRMMGAVLSEGGDLAGALECWRRAVELAPHNPVHHYNLGTALVETDSPREAVEHLLKATTLAPEFGEAFANLGIALYDCGKHAEAVAAYQRAIELLPGRAQVLHNLGNALNRLGRSEEAMAAYVQALEHNPRLSNSLGNIGNLLAEQGALDEAGERYRQALEIDPEDPGIHHNLGYVYYQAERFEEAAAEFEMALDLDPGFERSRSMLSRIERHAGLLELLAGKVQASSPAEWAEAVASGYASGRFRAVVELTEATLGSAAELTEVPGGWGVYNSACAAARLAADGDTQDWTAERLRGLARDWLAKETKQWTLWIEQDGQLAEQGRARLTHALQDTDFALVRAAAIEGLPESERAAWRGLWSKIELAIQQGR